MQLILGAVYNREITVSVNPVVLSPDKVLVAVLNHTLETGMLRVLFSYSHVPFVPCNPSFPIMAFSTFSLYCDFCMDEVFLQKLVRFYV